jgi:hypothetical protein
VGQTFLSAPILLSFPHTPSSKYLTRYPAAASARRVLASRRASSASSPPPIPRVCRSNRINATRAGASIRIPKSPVLKSRSRSCCIPHKSATPPRPRQRKLVHHSSAYRQQRTTRPPLPVQGHPPVPVVATSGIDRQPIPVVIDVRGQPVSPHGRPITHSRQEPEFIRRSGAMSRPTARDASARNKR